MSDGVRSPTTVAFLGTGLMGGPMARLLLDSRMLSAVWNRRAERASSALGNRLRISESPAVAVQGADIICLCLTDGKAAHEVMLGQDGFATSVRASKIPLVIDFTTSSPTDTKALASAYHAQTGGNWLDAPVSGGVARAVAGDLVIFCGGADEDFRRAEPVFNVVSRRATLVGEQGAGQAMKLCAQLIAAPTIVAIAEALAAAQANGIDVRTVPDILSDGLADSPLLQLFGRRMAQGAGKEKIGSIATMLKDIDAATTMARDASSPVAVGAVAAEIYRMLAATGQGEADLDALFHHFADGNSNKAGRRQKS